MPPSRTAKILASLAAACMATIGGAAIHFQAHTGAARRQGIVTLLGAEATAFGVVMLCLSLLPLAVWLPRRWLGWSLMAWWLSLMALLTWIVWR